MAIVSVDWNHLFATPDSTFNGSQHNTQRATQWGDMSSHERSRSQRSRSSKTSFEYGVRSSGMQQTPIPCIVRESQWTGQGMRWMMLQGLSASLPSHTLLVRTFDFTHTSIAALRCLIFPLLIPSLIPFFKIGACDVFVVFPHLEPQCRWYWLSWNEPRRGHDHKRGPQWSEQLQPIDDYCCDPALDLRDLPGFGPL